MAEANGKMAVAEDAVLSAFRDQIPAGWSMQLVAGQLVFERQEAVYVLYENRINAPLSRETAAERTTRIRRYGQALKPHLVYTLSAVAQQPGRLVSEHYTLNFKEMAGVENDFHSVDPEAASAELYKLQQQFEAHLNLVVNSLDDIETLTVNPAQHFRALLVRSHTISQHRMANPPGYPYSAYVEFGGNETVLYSQSALKGNGPWFLRFKVHVLEASLSDPARKSAIREIHLIAD